MRRIQHIDGLRGIAILSVILYHAFVRWTSLLPYGDRYAPLFNWGWLGVQLFFIISGFVIFMTLEKCHSFVEFMTKRWQRLFPAMLLATALIVLTAPLFARPITPESLIPGLSFIDNRWLGLPSLEGSFWSLYTEMKFYVFAGALYFTLGRRAALAGLIAGFLLYWALKVFPVPSLREALYLYDVPNWGWFACGALFYDCHRTGRRELLAAAILMGLLAAALLPRHMGGTPHPILYPLVGSSFVFLFAAGMLSETVRSILSNRFLLFVGAISYPLYLIHEQALIELIRLFAWLPLPGFLLPVLPLVILLTAAWVLARLETPLRHLLSARRKEAAQSATGSTFAR